MTSFRIQARNFRVLTRLDWSPAGVCLLSGANGAGKTSVLDALLFLRVLFERGSEAAFQLVGGNAEWMRPFVDAINGISVFKPYRLDYVQRSEAITPRQAHLGRTGANLWSVLSNWQSAHLRREGRFE